MRTETKLYSYSRAGFTLSRLCVFAGIVGPIVFVLTFTIDGLMHPNYSPLHQMISDLGVIGPVTWIQNTNFVVLGVLLVIFSIGFYQVMYSVMRRKSLVTSTVFLVIAGVGLVNDGFFTEDLSGTTVSVHGILHIIGFLVIFISLIFAFFISGRQLLSIPVWKSYGWYGVIASCVSLVLLVSIGPFPYHGLVNRLLMIDVLAWYVVMGLRLLAWQSMQKKGVQPDNLLS